MEESDEHEQPISLGRQEFRRRRRPSQLKIDKSQQTDAPEKKKSTAVVQPPVPKATLSIGNISGSKDNYSAKEYESLRLSSQLQQTWMKRKRGMEMTDKSLQTEASVEEKAKATFTDKTLTLEETLAGVGETAPELPQSVPEVEIPTSRPTARLIDRSQQTSCTGDWSVLNICPKDTVDKEQQTYLSELEITIINMPSSSPIKTKEETIPVTQEGSLFEVDGSLEIEVLSTEKVSDAMMPFTVGEFSGEIQALTTDELPSEEAPGDISHLSVQGALSYEPYDQEYPQQAEVDHSALPIEIVVPFTEVLVKVKNTAGKEETATAEESTDGVQPPPSEEASKEVQAPLDKQTLEAVSAEIAVVLAEEFPIEDVFEEGQLPPAEDVPEEVAPLEEAPARVLSPPAEEAPAEAPPAPAEEAPEEAPPAPAEETPAEASPPPAEETPAEASPPPAEETPAEASPPPTEEAPAEAPAAPAEEAPAEALPPPAEETPAEVPPAPAEEAAEEVPPPPAEEAPAKAPPAPAEEAPAEAPSPPAEEAPAEAPPAPAEEAPAKAPPAPAEEAPAEAPSAPAEEAPAEAPSAPAEVAPAEVPPAPAEEAPAEAPSPPAEEAPVEAPAAPAEEASEEAPPAPAEEAPAEVPPPPAEEAPAEASPPPAEEAPAKALPPSAEEAPAEVQFPQTQETPLQGVSVEVQPLSAEDVFTYVVPVEDGPAAETGSPSSERAPPEETTMEAQVTSVEESPEKASAGVQPLPPEIPAEESPVVKQPSKTDGVPIQEFSMQDTPDEASLAPSEQSPEDKTLLKEHQLSPVAGITEKELDISSLTGDRISEGTDPIPADVSRSKDEPISTFKIAGTIKIELKNPPS